MIRCPHRVNFRLTREQFERYRAMIGGLAYVHSWTELCLKGLEELAAKYKGKWNMPLAVPTHNDNGHKLEPPLLTAKDDPLPASDYPTLQGIPRPSRNGKKGTGYHKVPLKKGKKLVDKRRKRK